MEGRPTPEDADGGDPVCWLTRLCDACGALDDGPPAPVCGRCGTARAGEGVRSPADGATPAADA